MRSTKIMGMSLPRGLTSTIDSLVSSPRGRQILAGALVAAASAAAAALVKTSDNPQVAKAREAVSDMGDQVATASGAAAGALADMVTGAARSLLPASLTGEDEERGEGSRSERDEA